MMYDKIMLKEGNEIWEIQALEITITPNCGVMPQWSIEYQATPKHSLNYALGGS